MAKYKVQDIRNIAFCGHGGVGKTTLVDRLLTETGTLNRQASVDDGTSICDFDDEEKERKMSIESKLTHFEYDKKRFNVLDTPGRPDFIGAAIGAIRAVDTVGVVISAQSGIEVNTRRVMIEAEKAGVGRMIVINKMDGDNIDFPTLIENIQELFGNKCVLLNIPVGHGADFKGVVNTLQLPEDTEGALLDPAEINESLIESIIEVDEEVMERYFEGEMPTAAELAKLMDRAIGEGALVPIVCCSAKTGVGVKEMLDTFVQCGLSPATRKQVAADGETVIEPKEDAPLVAEVFKTRIDPFVQKLSFIRIYAGSIKKDLQAPVVGERKPMKLTQLLEIQANETSPVDSAGPGEIVAVAKMEDLRTGAVLGETALKPLVFPTPMVGLAATPKSRGDQTKLSGALAKLCEEDPTFKVDRDPQTKETVIVGMSELHLTVMEARLNRREKVEITTKDPKIPYRETIQLPAEGSYRHKKQSGGSGQFGEVHIRMYPLPIEVTTEEAANEWIAKMKETGVFPNVKAVHFFPESQFLWIDAIVGGVIPGNFMPAIEKGFLERLTMGVVAGYQVQNVCIEVHFGKDHPVDSNETAFKTAAKHAFRKVFLEAKPSLLEPIVKMEVTIPGESVGDINSDMSGRRGRVLTMESAGGDLQTIFAEAPLAEVANYARGLQSLTGGRGSYTLELCRYDVVPGNVQQEIIAQAKLEEEED